MQLILTIEVSQVGESCLLLFTFFEKATVKSISGKSGYKMQLWEDLVIANTGDAYKCLTYVSNQQK
jgi:hypothetical protein